MGQVIDYPDAPQDEVLRYECAFYGSDYGQVHISEQVGSATLDSEGLIRSDRVMFCFTYLARMIHNLGRHNAAPGLIGHVREKESLAQRPFFRFDDAREFDDVFTELASMHEADIAMYKQSSICELSGRAGKPRKTWSAILTRRKDGALVYQPKASLLGDVAAMSISSTLVLFNRTFRLATPTWRAMFMVGLGTMLSSCERYDHSKAEFLSVAPSAAWDAINPALESSSDKHHSLVKGPCSRRSRVPDRHQWSAQGTCPHGGPFRKIA